MITSINYLPSNAVGTSAAQTGSGSRTPLASPQFNEGGAVAQLSALGQVKSSLADLQNKAQALKSFSKPPTLEDFKVVVQGFVQSFNSISKSVKELTSKQSTLGTDSRPVHALNDVRKAVNGDNGNTFTSLQKLGISQQADGVFSINQKQLDKSFQDNRSGVLSAASDIADRVTLVTGQQLSSNGIIGKKANDFSVRATEPGNTRSKAQGYLNTQESSPQSPAVQLTSTGGNAAAAYSSVASL